MDFHERMGIAHALHTFWNPIGEDGVAVLLDALDLRDGLRVLDIACGSGELLAQIGERAAIEGIGVDVSRWALARAKEATARRAPRSTFTFHEVDAASYLQPADARPDIVTLVGASWIWKNYMGTLEALLGFVKPGGLILFGEPYWRVSEPDRDYCEAAGLTPGDYATLGQLHETFVGFDMRLVRMHGSSLADWDRYETLQSQAIDRWAQANPDHPDRATLLAQRANDDHTYLTWGREQFGFAQFVLRAPTR
jgi:SAM-dependent methyltransferase